MTYFPDSEFVKASPGVQLVELHRRAIVFWRPMLDAGREWYGGAVRVTSFLRNSGAHKTGHAVDLQPVHGGEAQIKGLADYFAGYWLGRGLEQVIYEPPEPGQYRGHVHLAAVLVGGATGGYLHEVHDGGRVRYVRAMVPGLPGSPPLASTPPPSPRAPELAGVPVWIAAGLGLALLTAVRVRA